ncbi:phospholipase D family protein [Terrabacter sp. 2RAF25]|uniref:phospholipase D family protein n=1 Tax=Terrabacter sp. 2RAF25 TaxID=3232998 RepID=UPI003F9795B0
MVAADWYLDASERGNPWTRLDTRHPDGRAWSEGNTVTPLIHGKAYFAELTRRVAEMRAGDLLLFVDWRGDPDERLTGEPGSEVARLFADAARRGVDVRGLVWRSHWDRLAFSADENRHLEEDVNAAGGECHLDMRVRLGGSHHQKFVVLRHPDRPELDVAFLGGIDLCHSRRDDADHAGDPQPQSMARVYGARPPWHDVQLALTGPVVGDVETVFRERWDDPQALTRSPVRLALDASRGDRPRRRPLPQQAADPAPTGEHPVQLLRTYGRRLGGYPFAPRGERSVARAYTKAFARARHLIYLEDQYLWSSEVCALLVHNLRRAPNLRLVAVLPHQPDQDGAVTRAPNLVSRARLLDDLKAAAPGRVAVYGIENPSGTPVYVHAKVCVVDDEWVTVGSDNFNRRSWTHDSELSAAVAHRGLARSLRQALAREHLGAHGELALEDHFDAYAASARALERWRQGRAAGGDLEARPPGRLRPLDDPDQSRLTRLWADPLYRLVYDPDGRPLGLRLRRTF